MEYTPIPANWFASGFSDTGWGHATEYREAGVKSDGDYAGDDFSGAKFIWTRDLDPDNTVVFRYMAPTPANYTKTWTVAADTDISNAGERARSGEGFCIEGAGQPTAGRTACDDGCRSDQLHLILYG